MKTKGKHKEVAQNLAKPDNTVKEAMTNSEFTYWLSLYRSRVFERYYAANPL